MNAIVRKRRAENTSLRKSLRKGKHRRHAPMAAAASYSRYSSELQDEASIDSQQAACRDAAQREGKSISPALQFVDRAVSGTKLDRNGLKQLLAAAAQGKFDTLYLSR
jgi:DNA invertase Pin-like site-specific DNA recombinase